MRKETENVNQMWIHGVLVGGSRCEGAAAVSSAELGVEYIISAKAGTATGVSCSVASSCIFAAHT